MKTLKESLDYLDMEGQLKDIVTVDEYAAKMGDDASIVTLTFTVNSKLAAKDLVTWLERGYDFVLDASISDGEIEPGQWLVFVEMERRTKVPERICKILADLETLTGMKLKDWKAEIEGDEVEADQHTIENLMILNPNKYKELKGDEDELDDEESDKNDDDDDSENEEDTDLNEYRELAGLEIKSVYENDEYIKNLKALAGM